MFWIHTLPDLLDLFWIGSRTFQKLQKDVYCGILFNLEADVPVFVIVNKAEYIFANHMFNNL